MVNHQMNPRAQEILDGADASYRKYHPAVIADPDYPALHLAPPVGRLNDPNGLVYKDGVYHAFYQYAPEHPGRDIFWRHAQSTDLVHWDNHRNAIAPIYWYDRNGCYSGSCFLAEDGTFELFYTGNVKNPDGTRETYQNLVLSQDDCKTFERSAENPLISGTPAGYTPHFRDPYVFERAGKFYAMIGTQREDLTGAIVLYSSLNRRNWEFEGEIDFSDPAINAYGYMLECPQVIELQDQITGHKKDVMLFCPQGMSADGERFNNKYQAGYIVGHLNGLYFEVETPFTEFDAGFEFYAPQVFHGSNDGNRALIAAWFGISDQDEMPSWDHRWLHLLTFPRWISLREGKLFQQPAEGLNQAMPLEIQSLNHHGTIEAVEDARVFRVAGELDVETGPVTIAIGDERGVAFNIEISAHAVKVDRTGTKYTVWGPQRTRTATVPSSTKTFDLLVDASALELFIDEGETTISGRSFFHGTRRTVQVLNAAGQPAVEQVVHLSAVKLAEER